MCLHRVTQTYNKTSMKIHVGYKVFKLREYPISETETKMGLFFPYFHYHFEGCRYNADYQVPVPVDTWMIAHRGTTVDNSGRPYAVGFHILRSKFDAHEWAETHCLYSEFEVRQVLFRNVTVKGEDECDQMIAVIAQEMLVTSGRKV